MGGAVDCRVFSLSKQLDGLELGSAASLAKLLESFGSTFRGSWQRFGTPHLGGHRGLVFNF